MRRLVTAVAMMGALWSAGAAQAAEPALDLLDAPVGYSAGFYVSSDAGTYQGRVWHVRGRERRDFDTNDGGQALLLRRDQDAVFLMKPSGKWYVGVGLHAAAALAGGLDSLTVERRRVRDEVVAGVPASRWKVAAAGPRGSRFDGDGWFSREGILVKAAGTMRGPDGRSSPVEIGLTNLKVGPVDERMLDLPAGYFGMDLRSIPPERLQQAVEGLRPMLEGRGAR